LSFLALGVIVVLYVGGAFIFAEGGLFLNRTSLSDVIMSHNCAQFANLGSRLI
jgi:hypothetical protein